MEKLQIKAVRTLYLTEDNWMSFAYLRSIKFNHTGDQWGFRRIPSCSRNDTNSNVRCLCSRFDPFFTRISIFVSLGVKAEIHHTAQEMSVNLILTDFCLFDPNIEARYPKVKEYQTFFDSFYFPFLFRLSHSRLAVMNYYPYR